MLIAFAALTARLTFKSWSMVTESFTIFLIFLGVMFESAICCRLVMAFVSFAWLSCCFLSLLLKSRTLITGEVLWHAFTGIFGFLFLLGLKS